MRFVRAVPNRTVASLRRFSNVSQSETNSDAAQNPWLGNSKFVTSFLLSILFVSFGAPLLYTCFLSAVKCLSEVYSGCYADFPFQCSERVLAGEIESKEILCVACFPPSVS